MKMIKKFLSIVLIVATALVLLCSCGLKAKNGFVDEGEGRIYYYVNGEKQIGWQKINNEWYYFYETDYYEGEYKGKGSMKYGTWLKKDGNYYFFDGDGKMLRGGLWKLDDEKSYYFDSDGKMLHDTQREINGDTYIFDSNGYAEALPDYQLVFNCTFPKMFREGSYSWSDVTIENINYKVKYDDGEAVFETYWSGTAGNTYKGKNHSRRRCVGWKLYDPNNYVINSGVFGTEVDLKAGEKFKDTREALYWLDRGVLKEKGIYRLELMDCE